MFINILDEEKFMTKKQILKGIEKGSVKD